MLLVVLAGLLLIPAAHAKWVAFDRTDARTASLRASGNADSFAIDVKVPGIDVTEKDGYAYLAIPGSALRMIKTEPELPLITMSVLLPPTGAPEVKLVVTEEKVIDLKAKVVPSKGHLTRDVDLATVPLVEGPVYKQQAFYPADSYLVQVAEPYILRDVRGTAVRICPVRYNPATGKLHVLVAGKLQVGMARKRSRNELARPLKTIDSEFAAIYRKLFVNYSLVAKGWTDINENVGRAIVICPDEWIPNMAPLQEWRATKGLDSKLVPVSQIVGASEAALTADQLKTYIKSEFDAGNLTWVLLVGDADKMPTLRGVFERAAADACLVKLAGDDNIPDVFISRFSCNNAAELDVQVARAIKYEMEPLSGDVAAGYRKATGIASAEGSPSDKERQEWLREIEMKWHFDVVDQIYDPGASKTAVAQAVNEGRSLINYIGHGSKTMWVTTRFGCTDARALTNVLWPMIWSVACVNGDFTSGSDCFGESWAKAGTAAAPYGAVGMVAASTNMAWVPPCVWQKAIIENYMVTGLAFTGGAQHHYGCLKACEEYGYEDKSEGVQIIEQCIYFGDASVVLRNDLPVKPTVAVESIADRALTLKIVAGDKPVKSARVVISTELNGGMTGCTDENGVVKLEFASGLAGVQTASATVTGPNLIPVINEALALPAPVPPTEPTEPNTPPVQPDEPAPTEE